MTKSDSTRNPPSKVWLVFDSESRLVDWANHRLGISKSDEQAHQYAPVQRPRRCVWVPYAQLDWWRFSCEPTKVTVDKPRIYCQFCGGKIKVKS